MENFNKELTCFEVVTIYKSGRKRTDVITAKSEEEMWGIYDKHHNSSLAFECMVADVWLA